MPSKTVDKREFSWSEFVECARANGPSGSAIERGEDKQAGRFAQASWADSLRMASEGWMPETPKVADLLRYVETDLGDSMHQSFEWYYDVSGSEVDITRFLAGEPENMINALPLKVMRTGRVIRLYVPATYPGDADSSQIIGRGIAIMALVECFSMLQHPTEIWAGICNHDQFRNPHYRTSYLVKVQGATEALDMGRIMFALAHPAFARQLGFSVKETCPKAKAMGFYRGGTYGSSSREIMPEDYADMADENVIVLPSIDNDRFDWTNEPKVVEWIKGQLERIQEGSN